MSLKLRVVFFVGSRLRRRPQTKQASALLPPHLTPEGHIWGRDVEIEGKRSGIVFYPVLIQFRVKHSWSW